MALNAPLPTPCAHSHRVRKTMRSWRKKNWHWCSQSNASIGSCIGERLPCSQIISHSPLSWVRTTASTPSQLHTCKGGLSSCLRTHMSFEHTKEHANADCLSCLPLHSSPGPEQSVEATCFNLGQVHALPVTAAKSECSWQDPLVSCVMQFTHRGWPATVVTELKLYHTGRHELIIEGQCLPWGIRVVVPQKLQQRRLETCILTTEGW